MQASEPGIGHSRIKQTIRDNVLYQHTKQVTDRFNCINLAILMIVLGKSPVFGNGDVFTFYYNSSSFANMLLLVILDVDLYHLK
jgi:hypothetical protein